jgi:hypothetical protein
LSFGEPPRPALGWSAVAGASSRRSAKPASRAWLVSRCRCQQSSFGEPASRARHAREHGPARVELAVRGALAAGAVDGEAVAVLARTAAMETLIEAHATELKKRCTAVRLPEADLAAPR